MDASEGMLTRFLAPDLDLKPSALAQCLVRQNHARFWSEKTDHDNGPLFALDEIANNIKRLPQHIRSIHICYDIAHQNSFAPVQKTCSHTS
jgi:hypothetical protein